MDDNVEPGNTRRSECCEIRQWRYRCDEQYSTHAGRFRPALCQFYQLGQQFAAVFFKRGPIVLQDCPQFGRGLCLAQRSPMLSGDYPQMRCYYYITDIARLIRESTT